VTRRRWGGAIISGPFDRSTTFRSASAWCASSTCGGLAVDASLSFVSVPEGSCTGTAATPAPLSECWDSPGRLTGVCPVCAGRFRLDADGRLPNHAPAPGAADVKRSLVLAVAALLTIVAVLASSAAAKTPVPSRPEGKGSEPTAGAGLIAGAPFHPRDALALLDISFDQVEIYLFPRRVACSDVLLANPPYLEVTVDTNGSPLIVDHPSPQNGRAFVQADFHPGTGNKYYGIQPGVSITFTRIDTSRRGVWHGQLTIRRQRFKGRLFSYKGTFAARWCGRD
jgi:hypothetical protein